MNSETAVSGPFAWNGLLASYVLCAAFFAWMVAMTWGMIRASKRGATSVSH